MEQKLELTATAVEKCRKTAKARAKAGAIPLNEALDAVARERGFEHWAHLVAADATTDPVLRLVAREETCAPGELPAIATRLRVLFAQDRAMAALQFGDLYEAERQQVAAGVAVSNEDWAPLAAGCTVLEFGHELLGEVFAIEHLRHRGGAHPVLVRGIREWQHSQEARVHALVTMPPAHAATVDTAKAFLRTLRMKPTLLWLRGIAYDLRHGDRECGRLPGPWDGLLPVAA